MADTGLDFALGEMADTIRETTARFAADRIAPLAARIDEEDWFPRELWPQMGELGLHGITVEEEFGGLGLGYLEHVVAQEEVARRQDRKSTRLNSSHANISYAVFCLKKKKNVLAIQY